MHKKILTLIIIAMLSFSSCALNNNSIEEVVSLPADTTATETSMVSVTTSLTEINEDDTSFSKNEWLRHEYFYDFDMDGENEAWDMSYGLIGELIIYKKIDGEFTTWGETIKVNTIYPQYFSVKNLTLYYDKEKNEYFYVNEYDMIEKYFNTADVNKYVITENGLIESNIAHCDFEFDGDCFNITSNTLLGKSTTPIGKIKRSELTHYYDGVEEYLSQFEKIKEITIEDLMEFKADNDFN